MKKEQLYEVLGDINENYINDAHKTVQEKSRPAWVKRGAIAACLCLVLVGVFAALPYQNWLDHQAEDPNWHLTHYETTSLSDIESICGTDLLIDGLSLSDNCFRNYNLEIVENGSFDNPKDWKSLSIDANYGKSVIDLDGENLSCYISFDGSTNDTYIMNFLNNADILEINGYAIEYNEMSSDEAVANGWEIGGSNLDYHGWAKFTHNGYTYYIATHSDSPDFFDFTLEQIFK